MREDVGKLLLRLTTGGLLLFYGTHKLLNGIGPVKDIVKQNGLPEVLANAVYLGEFVAPILVVIGLFTRIAAGVIAVDLLAAILLAGTANALKVDAYGGYALQVEAFFLLNALAIVLLGSGRLAIGGSKFN